ncbi:Dam family site-specific DNA-(adenine-N6)-methyltransferase [uncultured Trichococcus sp.]|uniref:DNA adenine methylase n=1 Tax=uncultured Trichococcus sp. TaxID=189665 RepID=UPI002A18A2C9|nr:Dam family site-specific DNA-(adenine-N6)-methyltransferase [uncultured Trichococcus sp.]
MEPFLKWPGGKRWLTKKCPQIFSLKTNTYIEPFVGGGSVYFFLEHQNAIISDLNRDLIKTYQALAKDPNKILERLMDHQLNHCSDYFYKIRSIKYSDSFDLAARFIYLNRTAFNGMYRVNQSGQFNVPIGTKTKIDYDFERFSDYSNLLKTASIRNEDFVKSICRAGSGDFIFADPPYTVSHNNNGFIQYNEKLFSWEDQIRLLSALTKAVNRGADVITTNAAFPELKMLYEDRGFYVYTISRYSSISGNNKGRNVQNEYIISSLELNLGQEETR